MFPLILADNRFLDGVPTATATATGFDALHIRDGRTYTRWMAPAPGVFRIKVNCAAAKSAAALGIIGHNLYSAGATIAVESSTDDLVWTTRLAAFTPSDDKALLKLFATVSAQHWSLLIDSPTVAPWLAVAMIGNCLEFPFPPDAPYTPYTESVQEESQTSKTGNPLGTVIRYYPLEIKPQFSHPSRSWVEDSYRPFRQNYSRQRKYFFWAWDLSAYPGQVFYVKDIGKYDPPVSVLAYYDRLKLELQGVME